ncbi:helix-turn-helix domain-containing protein [Sphingomonas faeni]|uniref:helix-turn-helix transcriptional regulator n=1 Tax=Sphingomonas faeni TaxID=185950 RepID=UPI000D3BD137
MTTLTIKEVAARTGVSQSTIRTLVARGRFPAPKRPSPRRIFWIETDIIAWLSNL